MWMCQKKKCLLSAYAVTASGPGCYSILVFHFYVYFAHVGNKVGWRYPASCGWDMVNLNATLQNPNWAGGPAEASGHFSSNSRHPVTSWRPADRGGRLPYSVLRKVLVTRPPQLRKGCFFIESWTEYQSTISSAMLSTKQQSWSNDFLNCYLF